MIIEFLTRHWLILNVLIPLLGACFIATINSRIIARKIFVLIPALSLLIAPFAPPMDSNYALGNWNPPIGIEYILDTLNYPFIIFLNIVLLLFCFDLKCLQIQVVSSITKSYRHLIFAVIALAHTGFTGILVTGDIFNIYVFIEIASLASYCLVSMSNNKYSTVGALEYLIIGTISATLILIGIGMLFSSTGTLNIKHMHQILETTYNSKMVCTGIALLMIGILIKVALFPMHFWMLKAYNSASSTILLYIASASPMVGFYLLLRIIHSVIGIEIFNYLGLNVALTTVGIIAILICSYYAFVATTLRHIAIFSATVQIGYICILIANSTDTLISIQYIFADSLMKYIFFYFITRIEMHRDGPIPINDLEGLAKQYPMLCHIFTFNIISNMGLPITVGFFNKMNLLGTLISHHSYVAFIAVTLTSLVGIEYNFGIIKKMYLGTKDQAIKLYYVKYNLGIVAATILSFTLIFLGKLL